MKSNEFCFVVNSYGRDLDTVNLCLKSISDQLSDNCSLFFINQNENQYEDHQLPHNVILVNQNIKSISGARNIALTFEGAKWLIFVDDDALLESSYIKNLESITNSIDCPDLISGTIKCIEDKSKYYSQRQRVPGKVQNFLDTKKIMGGNIAIKAEVFRKVGGFDEKFGIGSEWPSGEDTDLAWMLYFNNYKISLNDQLIIFHPSPTLIGHQKAYNYGLGKGALTKKWLLKGRLIVILEVIEMLAVPIIKLVLTFEFNLHLKILKGRIKGHLRYQK